MRQWLDKEKPRDSGPDPLKKEEEHLREQSRKRNKKKNFAIEDGQFKLLYQYPTTFNET